MKVILSVSKDAGIHDTSVVTKAHGLRASCMTRPDDIVVLDFFVDDRHLALDALVTSFTATSSSHELR